MIPLRGALAAVVAAACVAAATAGPPSWGLAAMSVPAAWSAGLDGAGVTVAIVDPGRFDAAHPFFAGAVDACIDLAGTARACHSTGSSATHGTKVAGIVRQVSPGARLVLLTMSGVDAPPSEQVQIALDLASGLGARVVVVSSAVLLAGTALGSGAALATVAPLELPDDVVLVAAAGNYGPAPGTVVFPAADASAISVGALHESLEVWSGSARGLHDGDPRTRSAGELDVAAPAMAVATSVPGGGFGEGSMTSMAAPHVGGLAALLLQRSPALDREGVRAALACSARDLSLQGEGTLPGYDIASGHGMPDASRLVHAC